MGIRRELRRESKPAELVWAFNRKVAAGARLVRGSTEQSAAKVEP